MNPSAFSFPDDTRRLPPRDEAPLNAGTFSVEEIAEANQRHDRIYGWSHGEPTHYTNLLRHPESVLGELDWDEA